MPSVRRKAAVNTDPKIYCKLCKKESASRWSPDWNDNDPWCCSPCVWALMGKKKEEISQEQLQQEQQQEQQQKDDNDDDYYYPWLKRDRLVALQLMKHGVSMYDCDPAKQFLCPYIDGSEIDFKDHLECVWGEYDILFGRFETHFEYPDPNYCYTHKHNILRKQTLGQNSSGGLFRNPSGRYVHEGQLLGDFSLDTPYPGIVPTEISFEHPKFHYGGIIYEDRRLKGMLHSIQTLTQDVALDWIPHNSVSGDSEYARAVRHAIDQERRRPLLWLCHHKDIPEDVSTIVREFTNPRPNMTFWLRRDDLWVTIEFADREHGVLTADLVIRRLQQET